MQAAKLVAPGSRLDEPKGLGSARSIMRSEVNVCRVLALDTGNPMLSPDRRMRIRRSGDDRFLGGVSWNPESRIGGFSGDQTPRGATKG